VFSTILMFSNVFLFVCLFFVFYLTQDDTYVAKINSVTISPDPPAKGGEISVEADLTLGMTYQVHNTTQKPIKLTL